MENTQTMNLELKHLAAYLPYGLKCNHAMYNGLALTMIGYSRYESHPIRLQFAGNKFNAEEHEVTPILRPLSDLTKEIEVNGERFVPIEVLRNKFNYIKGIDISYNSTYKTLEILCGWQMVGYVLFEQLHEWHFDVFGLIENGLAIDINTLK